MSGHYKWSDWNNKESISQEDPSYKGKEFHKQFHSLCQ